MKTLTRISLALALVFMAASPPSAQSIGNPQTITVIDSGTACVTAPTACATFSVLGSNAVAFDVSNTWTGTLTFEGDASGGGIWRTILVTNTADGTTATTTTSNGTFSVGNAGFYSVRVRATAAITGSAFVTATKGNLSAKLLTPSFSTATADVFCLNRSGQDIYIGRVAANDIGFYTGATACASGTLRFDVSSTLVTSTLPLVTGANPAQAGQLRLPNNSSIYWRNAANGADLLGFLVFTDNQMYFGQSGMHFQPNTNNLQDLGQSAETWRTGYFGTSVTTPTLTLTSRGTISATQNKLIQLNDTGNTLGVEFNVGTPTLGTCTGGSMVSGAKNTLFEVTGNTSGSCVINFGTPIWQNAPLCFVNDETQLIAARVSARSTNAITITGIGSGDAAQVYCLGRVGT